MEEKIYYQKGRVCDPSVVDDNGHDEDLVHFMATEVVGGFYCNQVTETTTIF